MKEKKEPQKQKNEGPKKKKNNRRKEKEGENRKKFLRLRSHWKLSTRCNAREPRSEIEIEIDLHVLTLLMY